MDLVTRVLLPLKKIRAVYKGWKVVNDAFDPQYVQYQEVKYKISRINDDLISEEDKEKDNKTFPYHLTKKTVFGRLKKEYYRTHDEAYEAMSGNLKNKVCAWVTNNKH
jgi:uncharacterized protein (UPF0262 family)